MEGKVIAINKTASYEYFIKERFEAGIKLEGAEVKSLRLGKVNVNDSFCFVKGGEVFLKNASISFYQNAGKYNSSDEKRDRKLLLKKKEISYIEGKVSAKGYTLVLLKLYFKDALIKAEVALCVGKHTYDKKKIVKEKDILRNAEREIKEYKR